MRRFIFSFVICFIVLFALLNSRFVYSQVSFWFSNHPRVANVFTSIPLRTKSYAFMPLSADKTWGSKIASADEGSAKTSSFILEIPSINVKAPIVMEASTNTDAIYKRLEDGVVHYSGTANPGEEGTSVILGHSSAYPWYKGSYGSVFALLSNLKKGDAIYVSKNGRYMVYKVKESVVFNPLGDDSKIAALEANSGSSLVLISCYPVGTNAKRIGIRADLVQ